nr:BAG family molecular chaperone regulator 3-like [Ipomoea batatas]
MMNKGLVRMKRNTAAGNGTMLSPAKNGDGGAAGWEFFNEQENAGDQMNREKRCPEMCRTVKMENLSKEITAIRLEIDRLAKQVKRVQKYIENLDMLKIRNSTLGSNNARVAAQFQQVHNKLAGRNNEGPVRVTAKWENF